MSSSIQPRNSGIPLQRTSVLLLPWEVKCPGRVCAALAAGLGGRSRCWFSLIPYLASLAVRVAGCPVRVSLPFACRYAIPCGLCVPRARSGCPSGPRCVSVACVFARAPEAYAPLPPPLLVGVARALPAVLVQGASRAVSGGSCPSAFPAPVPCPDYLAPEKVGSVPSFPCLPRGCSPPCGRVCPSELALRSVGAARGRPGGGALLAWVWGVWGWALFHT